MVATMSGKQSTYSSIILIYVVGMDMGSATSTV